MTAASVRRGTETGLQSGGSRKKPCLVPRDSCIVGASTAADRLSQGLGAPHPATAVGCLGPPAGASQQAGARVHRLLRRLYRNGVLARVRARTQSGGIHLGLLEATRVSERLPQGLLGPRRPRSENPAPHAPQAAPRRLFLEAVFFVPSLTESYAGLSKPISSTSGGLLREFASPCGEKCRLGF